LAPSPGSYAFSDSSPLATAHPPAIRTVAVALFYYVQLTPQKLSAVVFFLFAQFD